MASEPTQMTDVSALQNVPVVFVVGGPGSGKGTQCANLVRRYGFTHLSVGELLRKEVASGLPRGEEIARLKADHQSAPCDMIFDLLKEAIMATVSPKGFLIDSFPRDVEQRERFETEIVPARLVLFFKVPNEVMTQRLLERAKTSGRADDNEEKIKERLKKFEERTQPLDFYEKEGKLKVVDACASVDEVFMQVVPVVDKLMSSL